MAMANPAAGEILTRVKMTDPRWPESQGWQKMQQLVEPGGKSINVHYLYNPQTNQMDDFKIIIRGE